jgi:dipeptide/tripeptide permease
MEFKFGGSETNQKTVLNHPSGLFVLFFTEMWERFSYYGMRALLVLFLTASLLEEGWAWERSDALTLYGFYTGLVYLTPIIGGLLADKFFGYRKAVVLGALIMTLGHASMALETPFFFYLGLTCLILGNGLFKPNISSIVGNLYKTNGKEKDAGYTIFYMGINAGAFLGILLCGYLGEKVGWAYGFGLAGIFMFLGMLQFYWAQKIFGKIGLKPEKELSLEDVPVTDPSDNIKDAEMNKTKDKKVERDRITVILILAFFTIFFWMAFEQAGGSMTIFAKDYTDRILKGSGATMFNVINTLLTVVPLIIITIVLALLFRQTFGKYPLSNFILGFSFLIIWGIAIWLIQRDYNTASYNVQYENVNGEIEEAKILSPDPWEIGEEVTVKEKRSYSLMPLDSLKSGMKDENGNLINADNENESTAFIGKILSIERESTLGLFWKDNKFANIQFTNAKGETMEEKLFLPETEEGKADMYEVGNELVLLMETQVLHGIAKDEAQNIKVKVQSLEANEVEVPASWFGILNSFFIIAFAPLFSRLWQSRFNPSGPVKFALGLILLGVGFAALAYGASTIPSGAKTASVSLIWLVLAYLLHTLGELCLSPVGLSYVSKLAPARLVSMMFGLWFFSNFVANLLAGLSGSFIDSIAETYSLTVFFLIFTALPIAAGLMLIAMNKFLLKKMHGIT